MDDKKRKLSRIQNTLDELIAKEKIEDNSEKLEQNLEVLLLQSIKIVKENDKDIAATYDNIGYIFNKEENYKKAL